ncbi:unnamed protein product [Adineta ricciae]|uniref:Secreted protein n=1 Tax=Adineta ricciae TaxID=249248 RepID=A0A815ULV6_ADIRI|nr:unnamed protein product [Adineta ricciae]
MFVKSGFHVSVTLLVLFIREKYTVTSIIIRYDRDYHSTSSLCKILMLQPISYAFQNCAIIDTNNNVNHEFVQSDLFNCCTTKSIGEHLLICLVTRSFIL